VVRPDPYIRVQAGDLGGALVERPPSFFDYSLNGIAGIGSVLNSGINLLDYVPGFLASRLM